MQYFQRKRSLIAASTIGSGSSKISQGWAGMDDDTICQELRHSHQFLAAAAHDPTFVIVTLT